MQIHTHRQGPALIQLGILIIQPASKRNWAENGTVRQDKSKKVHLGVKTDPSRSCK